ncbi:MAG TPA: DUF885 domain-containing protein [Nakamurella sp.]|jgi:uncharacterized protein (DUF885 family)
MSDTTPETTAETTAETASAITELSNAYVAEYARRRPIIATYIGVPVEQDRLDDLTPTGLADRYEFTASTARRLAELPSTGPADDIAREVLIERLEVDRDRYLSGWSHADLNVVASPLQGVREVFDLMPTDTVADVGTIARRMAAVPAALLGYRQSLRQAADDGRVAAVRQVDRCAEQCDVYSGRTADSGFFSGLARQLATDSIDLPKSTARELAAAATAADQAYADLADFLRTDLRGRAPEKDAVGRERYELASRDFLGAVIDLEETYQWGWSEFLTIEAELRAVAERIAPGEGPAGAAAALDRDPAHQLTGVPELQAWMQDLSDRAIDELGRTHFDIPEPIRRLECLIAPPGGLVGAYYTGPSDDFTRPGRMWWGVEPGREVFNTWREASSVYHEGVPGHHLQVATSVYRRDMLNDFQRLLADYSAHAEGWALYAERLVRELGYLADDGRLLGLLDAQLFRSARVVLDIGMHLELPIPAGTGFHEGERWTPELGLEFLLTRTVSDPAHCRYEIDRYLGWPGQAPGYKVGERVWLAGRDAARRRHGDGFDLRAFHTAALNMGAMGLDVLARRLALL